MKHIDFTAVCLVPPEMYVIQDSGFGVIRIRCLRSQSPLFPLNLSVMNDIRCPLITLGSNKRTWP